jgi:hypothetical protein
VSSGAHEAICEYLAEHLSADELAHLAAAKRLREQPAPRIDEAAVAELADMLAAGRRPSLGWWRDHLLREPK